MNRLLACTIALCAAASTAQADDQQVAPAAPSAAVTITSEIGHARDQRVSGDLNGAAKILQQLLLVAGDDPRVLGEYGKVLVQQGHAKDAVRFLARAAQLNGSDWTLYSALGVAYDQADDHPDARKAYDHALAIKPGEPSVLNNYAVSRMLSGDYAGAVQALTQLETSDSTDPKIAANLAKAQELLAAHPAKAAPAAAQIAKSQPNNKPAPVAVASLPIPNEPAKAVPAVAQAAKSQPSNKPVPVAVASLPAANEPAKAGVIMQKVPTDPLAGPVRQANGAPRALIPAQTSKPTLTAEAAKLHVAPGAIVMQKVPTDPKAGPVKTAEAPKPAAKNKPAAEAAKSAPAPLVLRTASDR